jgi:hypothetical protein
MKRSKFGMFILTAAAAAGALAVPQSAQAGTGTSGKAAPAPVEEPAASNVSGTFSVAVDTHFISYGSDVWAGGSDWSDALVHPQLVLNFALSEAWTLTAGTWWDINDKAESSIGGDVQEVDVWLGASYKSGITTYALTYQEWMYANDSERIVDAQVSFDTFFKPYILIHGRVDGNGGQDTGVVGVLGGSYGFELGPVAISLPVAVAFATEDFHAGDAGFAYASAGVSASVPLSFISDKVSLTAGATYYHTEDSVIPNNPDSDFVTGSVGLAISF